MIYFLAILGGIIDRLRGWDPADWYEQRSMTPPRAAVIVGDATSRGVMSILSALIVGGYAWASGYSLLYQSVSLAIAVTASFWIIGGQGRSRTYQAYSGIKTDDESDFTKIVGNLIPGDAKIINHIRGIVESAFYCAVMTAPVFVLLILYGEADAILNYVACFSAYGLAKAVPSFLPREMKIPDYNFSTGKIEKIEMWVRNPVAEFLSGSVLIYWILVTVA